MRARPVEGCGGHQRQVRIIVTELERRIGEALGADISLGNLLRVTAPLPWSHSSEVYPRPWSEKDEAVCYASYPHPVGLNLVRRALMALAYSNRYLPPDAPVPQVKVRTIRAGNVWRATIEKCVYCGLAHSHGVELKRDAPGQFGFKQHGCENPNVRGARGYFLVDRRIPGGIDARELAAAQAHN